MANYVADQIFAAQTEGDTGATAEALYVVEGNEVVLTDRTLKFPVGALRVHRSELHFTADVPGFAAPLFHLGRVLINRGR